jgi:hypothetical protein
MEIYINFLNLTSVKPFHHEEEFHLLEIPQLLLKCTPRKMPHIKHMINGAFITSGLGVEWFNPNCFYLLCAPRKKTCPPNKPW